MKKVLLFLLVGLLPVGLFAQQGDNNQQKTLVFTHATPAKDACLHARHSDRCYGRASQTRHDGGGQGRPYRGIR
jgi:hypothetical protein